MLNVCLSRTIKGVASVLSSANSSQGKALAFGLEVLCIKLLEDFHNINKLTINCDKTKLLVSCKNKLRKTANLITLKAAEYNITQTPKIKVLGIYITNTLNNQATINNIISKVNYRLSIVREIYKYSSEKTKTLLATSMIMSVIRYACPILSDSTKNQLSTLQTLINKCSRPILGFKSFKWSTLKIMDTLKWNTIYHMIIADSLKFVHRPIFENLPPAINKYITYSTNRGEYVRYIRKPFVTVPPSSEKLKRSLIYLSIKLHNQLPENVRVWNVKYFNKNIGKYIREYFPPFQIDTG